MIAVTYQFRPNLHWNHITEAVYLALLRAGYGPDRLTCNGSSQ